MSTLDPRADHHTHTSFSDGADDLDDMVRAAARTGLYRLAVTDHVRVDTDWVPAYVAAVRAAAIWAHLDLDLDVVLGVETKMLDTSGRLDLPANLRGVEQVAVADHRLPTPHGPALPADVIAGLRDGTYRPADVVDMLVGASVRALTVAAGIGQAVLVHPFSILPKVGLTEDAVDDAALRALADGCRAVGAVVEVNEKWRCPSVRVTRVLDALGVDLVAGSDAHRAAAVGRFSHVRDVARALDPAPPLDPASSRPARPDRGVPAGAGAGGVRT